MTIRALVVDEYVCTALGEGVSGFLLKNTPPDRGPHHREIVPSRVSDVDFRAEVS